MWVEWYNLYIIFVPVFMFLLIPFRMELTGETKGFLRVRVSDKFTTRDSITRGNYVASVTVEQLVS